MLKLCLNSRDELVIINLEKVACFKANGNYTSLHYISKETRLLSIGLTKTEELIRRVWPADRQSPFIRLGRSLIINQSYLSEINLIKQHLGLSDCEGNKIYIKVPKPLLKEYKEKIKDLYFVS